MICYREKPPLPTYTSIVAACFQPNYKAVALALEGMFSDDAASPNITWIAEQTLLRPRSEHYALVKTTAFCFHTVKRRITKRACQIMSKLHDKGDILSLQPFLIIVSNFSHNMMQLTKHEVVAYVIGRTTFITKMSSSAFQHSPVWPPRDWTQPQSALPIRLLTKQQSFSQTAKRNQENNQRKIMREVL